mgnify:FL=1|jgi:hypothetical protein|tara:strand:- start:239 stop:832 length:594 start_codon:yes stop_codon:yes gene_type:complete
MNKLPPILLLFLILYGCKIKKNITDKSTENQRVLIDEYRYEKGFLTDLVFQTVPLFGLFSDGDLFDLENGLMDAKSYLDEIQPFLHEEKLFTGIIFDKYENGKLAVEVSYKDGILHGPFKFWNKKGELAWYVDNENGLRIEEVRFFESNEMFYVSKPEVIIVSSRKQMEIKIEDGIVRVSCWDAEYNTKTCPFPILF